MSRAVRRPRRLTVLVAALSAVTLLTAPVAASAAPSDGGLVLAVSEEPLGPDPSPRDAEENPARDLGGYEDREVPFTWGAAWLLTFLGVGGVVTMLAVYRRSVARPTKGAARGA